MREEGQEELSQQEFLRQMTGLVQEFKYLNEQRQRAAQGPTAPKMQLAKLSSIIFFAKYSALVILLQVV